MSLLDTLRGEKREAPVSSEPLSNPKLQDLISIAMVIVGGCEPCAENMVKRALQQGSSWHDIDKTLHIIASMQKLDCFAKAVGPEVIARMEKPLAAGRGTLQQAKSKEGQ
jgi:hypothetical protein